MENENRKPFILHGRLRVNPWEGGEQKGLCRLGPIDPDFRFIGQPEQKGAGDGTSPPRSPDKAPGPQA
jgi:hypothetical protein